MASLAPALRKKLEDAVKEARDVAEAGARAALEQLAVHAAEPFAHLSPEDRELRNRLRARARQLGDGRDTRTGAHQIDHLVVECAYEHWHRMLFARFLAENGVLMANSEALGIENTPVTLEECEELAADEGAANGWELAGRYASKMLPQIFRPDAPVLAVHLPPERQRRLEQILAELSRETFKASDALGWVYQFWQAKKKDEVNASGVKIGADELPAVTQLFTEPYMVEFLLHNTLGAWWAGKVLAERPELARTAKSEDELREACGLPGYSWTYLRFARTDNGWRPAAGTFEDWPGNAAAVTVLDPYCGSGHFLVAAFEILVRLRMYEEHLGRSEAIDAVLGSNLYGLEIDERCSQIAACALALAAWTFGGVPAFRRLPPAHIACCGVGPQTTLDEWRKLAGGDQSLVHGMKWLHKSFQPARDLGSFLRPDTVGFEQNQRSFGVATIESLLSLFKNRDSADAELSEMGTAAREMLVAAEVLCAKYTLVATNVPFLTLNKQGSVIRAFLEEHHAAARHDVACAAIERAELLVAPGGTLATVSPQNWLFLKRYKPFRVARLKQQSWHIAVLLGPGAFSAISGEVVKPFLWAASRVVPSRSATFHAIDVGGTPEASEKEEELKTSDPTVLTQSDMLSNPDSVVVFTRLTGGALLGSVATALSGCSSGDAPAFVRKFWEVALPHPDWEFHQSTVSAPTLYGGRSEIIFWEGESGRLARLAESVAHLNHAAQNWRRGKPNWRRSGVVVSQMGDLHPTLYTGEIYDCNCCAVVPNEPELVPALWAYCASGEFAKEARRIDKALKITPQTILNVPFDIERWTAAAQKECDRTPSEPSSVDCTQWVFHGHARSASEPLQVAVAHLLGYRWPAQKEHVQEAFVDDDGVVCIPSVRGELSAADRLEAVLAAVFGRDWTPSKKDSLLAACDARGKSLAWWLQNKFFEQHCQLFQNRPFLLHIWDGVKKDGFGALVNYHKLDRKLLETLTYTYLGDWIRRQQDDAARKVDGASERLDAARRLQQSLELILEGEKPHDIFVRWKPLHEQPMGWEPDLNDGVRVNIRPFMSVPDVDKKGAGVLRSKPNIHWKKDRGADHADCRPPWFELGPAYGEPKGARINDHHLSLAEKRAARERARGR